MSALEGLSVKAKARRFRALLPLIERKITEGVRHADIISALEEQGLSLQANTYFTYLRRYRKASGDAQVRLKPGGLTPPPAVPLPVAAAAGSAELRETDALRPPRFDYNPRGIPDLLK